MPAGADGAGGRSNGRPRDARLPDLRLVPGGRADDPGRSEGASPDPLGAELDGIGDRAADRRLKADELARSGPDPVKLADRLRRLGKALGRLLGRLLGILDPRL